MSGKLYSQIEDTLLPGMHVPEPLRKLFDWIETQGTYKDSASGVRLGFLFPEAELKAGWTDDQRPGGTDITFCAEGNVNMKYWFRHEEPEMLSRLCVFAQTGAEGSMAAFWLDEDGTQKIVHMGSGSGSMMCCTLADDPVDFLRLLAIGYDEICWDDQYSEPPNSSSDFIVLPNTAFQDWVKTTFQVEIPTTGSEIVKHIGHIGEPHPLDPFGIWVERMTK